VTIFPLKPSFKLRF